MNALFRPRFAAGILVVAAAVGVIVGTNVSGKHEKKCQVAIESGSPGGVYYPFAVKLAQIINEGGAGWKAHAVATNGSADNLRRLFASDVARCDFALSAMNVAVDAREGIYQFTDGKLTDIRAVARLHDDVMHLVIRNTPQFANVRSIEDLRGSKIRVAVGTPDSGTRQLVQVMLRVARLGEGSDLSFSEVNLSDAINQFTSGQIDAFFWSGGAPSTGITDLARKTPMRMVPLADLLDGFRQSWYGRYPWAGNIFSAGTIPANAYPAVAATPTIAVPNLLVTRRDADPKLVEHVTRLLYEHAGDLAPVIHTRLQPATSDQTYPISLQTGAAQYYHDEGVG